MKLCQGEFLRWDYLQEISLGIFGKDIIFLGRELQEKDFTLINFQCEDGTFRGGMLDFSALFQNDQKLNIYKKKF